MPLPLMPTEVRPSEYRTAREYCNWMAGCLALAAHSRLLLLDLTY